MTDNIFSNNNPNFYWFFGVVEDRDDPLCMGRLRLRIMGYHTDNKEELPTEDLPWAMPIQPAISAGTSGIGWSPTGPVEGTWCWGFFMDGEEGQLPAYVGTIAAAPQSSGGGGGGGGDSNSPGSGGSGGSGGGKVDPAALEALKNCNCSDAAKRLIASGNKANINAIIKGAAALGWTQSAYPHAVAALLAIAGGESQWQAIEENLNYKAQGLTANFSRVRDKGPDFALRLASAGKVAVGNFLYGQATLGNKPFDGISTDPNMDGWKYRGRGFIQITGKANYGIIGKKLGIDLINNPGLLISNVETCTKCTIEYFTSCRKVPLSSLKGEQAMEVLLKAVGGIKKGWPKKRETFKCFMENLSKNGKFI